MKLIVGAQSPTLQSSDIPSIKAGKQGLTRITMKLPEECFRCVWKAHREHFKGL